MSQQTDKKQFSIAGYTPAGYQVTINFAMAEYPNWDKLDKRMQALGLLPAVSATPTEPTKTEIMTHVARRDHYNKNGTTTPHIAFYSASQHLEMRYLHIYMDAPSQLAAFQQAAGMPVSLIKAYDADSHPKRDNNPRSKRYIIELPQPVTIEYTEEAFTGDDGKEGTRKKFVRYVSSVPSGPPEPAKKDHEDESAPAQELGDKITALQKIGRQLKEADSAAPAQQNTSRWQRAQLDFSIQSKTPLPTLAQISNDQRGTLPQRDDKRGRVTRLRVHGRDLTVGDCIERESPHESRLGFRREIWRITAIGDIDSAKQFRRSATVLVIDSEETREVTFNAGSGVPMTYHMVVGGAKLDAVLDDPGLYEVLDHVGATWAGSEPLLKMSV